MLFAIFVLQGIGVALMSETSTAKPGAVASLRIQLGLPTGIRTPILLVQPA